MLVVAGMAVPSAAQQTTAITGKVTARGDDRLRVEFEPHTTAAPAVGDAVTFTAVIRGIEVGGGAGEVVEAGREFVWVRRTSGNPGLQMRATIAATGTRAAGGGSAKREPATGGGSKVPASSLLSGYQSLQNNLLRRSLEQTQKRLDETRLRTTPEGRATLAAMQRLLASTRSVDVNAVALPPGVTERMLADAERALLFRQIVDTGRWLSAHLKASGIVTRTASGAEARAALVRGAQTGERAAQRLAVGDDLKRLVDMNFFMAVSESSAIIRAAVSRLSQDDRRNLHVQAAEFEEASLAAIVESSRFSLAFGKGAEAEESAALAFHQALFRYRTAALRIVEAVDLHLRY
jgi:hypothetical protein